jgi:hypothetical protein
MGVEPDVFTAPQAAELLGGISVVILRRQAQNGVILARKAGRRRVFSQAE